ncbi:Coproporphyrinogen III oxidase, oxygen-independent, partial [hydrothermal vent metagenome]
DEARLPIARGVAIDDDDRLRAEIIQQLICHGDLNIQQVEREFAIHFDDYFQPELEKLQHMQADGLLEVDGQHININQRGSLLIRNICKVFDRYRADQEGRFSKMI